MDIIKLSPLTFFVNGRKIIEKNPDIDQNLLGYLRDKLRLCGAKEACGEGGCGACTVMISKFEKASNKISNLAVNACLTPLCSIHGCSIVTVEGLGSVKDGLHPVQERIAKSHGTQCGFCTPGFVMSMYALIRNKPYPSEKDIEEAFQGNLCRCTGYRPILEGFKTFCEPSGQNGQNGCCMGGEKVNGCCKNNGQIGENACMDEEKVNGCSTTDGQNGENGCTDEEKVNGCTDEKKVKGCSKTNGQNGENGSCNGEEKANGCCKANAQLISTGDVLFDKSDLKPYDPTQDPIFPPELKVNHAEYEKLNIFFQNGMKIWYRPGTIREIFTIRAKFPDGKIIAGNTELGVHARYLKKSFTKYIQISSIPVLKKIEETTTEWKIGSCVTISQLQTFCSRKAEQIGSVFWAINQILNQFGGPQIRNTATVGGNILSSRHVSDLLSIFMAAGTTLIIETKDSKKEVRLSDFVQKGKLGKDEILLGLKVPKTKENEFIWGAKQSRRKEDDIAIVNCGMKLSVDKSNFKIKESNLVFGGFGPKALHAQQSSKFLIGKEINENLPSEILVPMKKDLEIMQNLNKGMVDYKLTLAPSLFYKFYLHIETWLKTKFNRESNVKDEEESGMLECTSGSKKSSQLFQVVPESQEVEDLVGRPIPNLSSFKNATGEAEFTDDIPPFRNELFACLVLSTRAHAKIISIDPNPALALPKVVGFMDAKSISPERNVIHLVVPDEQIFATDIVTCVGQTIGVILAKDKMTAETGAKLVKVVYEDISPKIITIEDAIEHESFYEKPIKLVSLVDGDVEKAFLNCDEVAEGKLRIGGQEHFYMESQACIAVPKEDGEMEINLSTQGVTFVQLNVCSALGLQQNRVVVKCRRAGGGFGGKENRCLLVALPAAIAAQKHRVPVRCVMNRMDDMLTTGGREPYLIEYKVGFNKDGKIMGVKIMMYANGGNTLNLSLAVVEKTAITIDGGYKIPNWDIKGHACKTNLPSNTAFRGFGGPEGIIAIEAIIDHVANLLQMEPDKVRELNMYNENDVTPYGEVLENCTMKRCWEECLETSNYHQRVVALDNFNTMNKWKKRGIAICPIKFAVGFSPIPFLAQSGALVSVFQDGSVCLNFGGIELGQGLVTKMIQVASRVLKIGPERIYTGEMITHRVPNSSPSVGSMSSDFNGPAVIAACEKILKRLEPFKEANPKGTWENWVHEAYFARTNLNAVGFYKQDHVFNMATKEGKACTYICYGVGASEVEIDCLTGDHTILRTDIVMDAGESLNPAIDIGQIEGAFIQGCGLVTIEEMLFSPDGHMITKGAGNYKIPSVGNIPQQFHVSLLRGAPNPKAVYSSKAIGEPPLLVAASVLYAIKNAIDAFRKERNLSTNYRLSAPATCERIRLLCEDEFAAKMKGFGDKVPPYSVIP